MSGTRKRRFFVPLMAAILLVAAGLMPGLAYNEAAAANGDFVHKTYFQGGCGFLGVGIAFDGRYLWYSCYGSNPDLYKADPLTGNIIASYNVAGGLGSLAWDGKRKKIWAGWGAGAGAEGDVRLIDPNTGIGTVVFNATNARQCGLDDGIAYDAQDDTLYISPDCSYTIHHYSVTGTYLGNFPYTGSGCYNSGLALGGDLLYQGADGCNHVWVIRKSDHSAAFDFSTVVPGDYNFRDEGLACDSVTFSPKTVMWSIEAYEPRRAVAFEVPAGSCANGGGVDSDGDGLLDDWEKVGVWVDPDGAGPLTGQFIDLPAMGADPNKPDVFLQIDWMEDATHSQKLDQNAIKRVVDAFANSPYVSPTGSVGINLHVDEGPTSIMNFATNATWGTLSKARALSHVTALGTWTTPSSYDWSAFQTIKDAAGGFTSTGRTPVFHYVIAAHNVGAYTYSGISRDIGASDFIVSLGSFNGGVGTQAQQAGTLMHELGHNLGLRHGGGDNDNYKPNYLSVMNYSFQLNGLIQGGVQGPLDYSRMLLPGLNENSLSEPAGLGAGAAGYGTIYRCPNNSLKAIANGSANVDWNCDGDATDTGVASDISRDGAQWTLNGYNDWTHITFKGGAIGLAGVTPVLPMITDNNDNFTPEMASQIPQLAQDCSATPTLSWLPPLSADTAADVNAADALGIRFKWNSCNPPDTSVAVRIRNAATGMLITGTTYGGGITYDSGSGEYRQSFTPAQYGVTAGTQLKVMVYFGSKLRSTALVNVH